MNRALRWVSVGLAAAGLMLGLLAMTGSPWLHVDDGGGRTLGIHFSLVQRLVQTAKSTSSAFPVATDVYFGWAAWVLLVLLTIGATLAAFSLFRPEIIGGVTAVLALLSVALLLAAYRPILRGAPGIDASSGPWLAGAGYVLLGAAAVIAALGRRPAPRAFF